MLRAAQTLVDDGIARPILLGRRAVIERKVHEMGLRIDLDRWRACAGSRRRTTTCSARCWPTTSAWPVAAASRPRMRHYGLPRRGTVAAAMLLHAGLADAAICGGSANWWRQMQYLLPIIPRRPGVSRVYGLGCLILQHGTLFICDTQMVVDPTAEQIAEMTVLAAEAVGEFGITPKAALLSHSNFGASDSESARKMRRALALLRERAPELEVDGEMHADAALVEAIRDRAVPDSRLSGTANLLVMPTLDAANIAFTLLKAASDGLPVGPMLLGMSKPIHVLVPSVTARGIVNLSAFAALEAQSEDGILDASDARASATLWDADALNDEVTVMRRRWRSACMRYSAAE